MKNVYLIGNAHLDPVWLWKKSEGLSEILSTFRSALDRMNEFPDYIFTSACAAYYEWVERVDPIMFREIQRRVKEGRWSIAGGYWVQPDCNIPSGESFARHALYSQRYFKEKFEITATVGYNVDSFGHNGMLPQLLKKSGMTAYIFMRPEIQENPDLPDLFFWESPDGSRVLVHKINEGYSENWAYPGEADPCRKKVAHLRQKSLENCIPYLGFYGVGNHGGGPTIQGLKTLTKIVEESDDVCFASVGDYFADLGKEGKTEAFPMVKGGLHHHASGCYAANAAIKSANRRAENALIEAEKYDLLATRLLGCESLKDRLEPAWRKVLFNQFHDILAGCCIREAYSEALDAFSSACDTAEEIAATALHRLSWNICTLRGLDSSPCQKNGWILWEKEGEGAPLVVFNPHSFPLREVVSAGTTVSGVSDFSGDPVPCQNVRGPQTNKDDLTETIFQADIPPFGYAVYYIFKNQRFDIGTGLAVQTERFAMENECLRVAFDERTGLICSFYDKRNNRELTAAPMAKGIIIDDSASDTWAHGKFVFDSEIGTFGGAEIRILESGPVRAGIRVVSRYRDSVLRQDFLLSAGADRLEVRCRLDFHEKLKLVKLCFPVSAAEPVAVYSIPYGFTVKVPDGAEEPSHEWMCIADQAGMGMSLCNDSKYSFSAGPCNNGAEMRMTIARGAIYADHFGERDDLVEYQDQGEQYFRYVLTPKHDAAETSQSADVLNMPPVVLMETHHQGRLAGRYEGIRIYADNIVLAACKNAEDGRGYILRLVETAGRETAAEIDAVFLNTLFRVRMKPQEVKTLYVDAASGEFSEVLLTEL